MRVVIVSTLGLDSPRLHGADRLLTLDADAPSRWRRAYVRTIPRAGIERVDGVTLAWGLTAAEVEPMLRMAPTGAVLLVVLGQTSPPGHSISAALDRWRVAGLAVELIPVPAIGAVYELQIQGRHVVGLPLPLPAVQQATPEIITDVSGPSTDETRMDSLDPVD